MCQRETMFQPEALHFAVLEATMSKNSAKSVLVLAVLAVAGCASIPENDPAMEDARVSVNAARNNPHVVTYAAESSIRPSRHCVKPKTWLLVVGESARCNSSRRLRTTAQPLRKKRREHAARKQRSWCSEGPPKHSWQRT